MVSPHDFPWTAAQIDQLRYEWSTGASCSAISRTMRVSRNSIVGKAHRLGLPGRPSPIIYGPREPVDLGPSRAERVAATALPPLPSVLPSAQVPWPVPWPVPVPVPVPEPVPEPPPVPVPKPVVVRKPAATCAYPLWSSDGPVTHVYCDGMATRRGYCDRHARLCLVRVANRGLVA